MSKHFVVNPNIESQDKDVINKLRQEKEAGLNETFFKKRKEDESKLQESDNLRFVEGKVIIKIDINSKDSWTFTNGQKIEYKRRFNNFNKRQTEPVNAFVISGEGMKAGSEILIHQNAIHDSARIFDYKDSNPNIQYYSIQEEMCFAWYDEDEKQWKPLPPYDFALRIFKPYDGIITGIEPELVKNMLWVTTGELKNIAVITIIAVDFEVIFMDRNGREGNLIRFRPFGDGKTKREAEAIGQHNGVTEDIINGKLLVGYTIKDAKRYE
jgi:hypothetical protein